MFSCFMSEYTQVNQTDKTRNVWSLYYNQGKDRTMGQGEWICWMEGGDRGISKLRWSEKSSLKWHLRKELKETQEWATRIPTAHIWVVLSPYMYHSEASDSWSRLIILLETFSKSALWKGLFLMSKPRAHHYGQSFPWGKQLQITNFVWEPVACIYLLLGIM